MPAFDEAERQHAYGCYSGCPCKAKLETRPPESPLRLHPEDKAALKAMCPEYAQKDGNKHSNWNRGVKLPYGEWEYLTCAHDTGMPMGRNICRLSLRAENSDDEDFKTECWIQDEYLKEML